MDHAGVMISRSIWSYSNLPACGFPMCLYREAIYLTHAVMMIFTKINMLQVLHRVESVGKKENEKVNH